MGYGTPWERLCHRRTEDIPSVLHGECGDLYSELTVVGVNGSSPDHNKQALALMASGEVPVKDLITHRLPLDKVLDAIGIVEHGEGVKVVIQP